MNRLRESARGCLLGLLPLLWLLCGCAKATVVLVTVTGASAELSALRVTTLLDDTPALETATFDGAPGQLALVLPDGTSGVVGVEVEGVVADQCVVALGAARGDVVPGGQVELRVALARTATKLCTVFLTSAGEGRGTVTSDPAGLSCGRRCHFNVPQGSTVQLTPTAERKTSYFAGWSGACAGSGACQVVVSGPTRVTAAFGAQACSTAGLCFANPLPAGPFLYALSGVSATEVWAVGEGGQVLRWDGTYLAPQAVGSSATLFGAAAVAAGDGTTSLWIVGDNGTVLRRSNGAFATVPSGTTAPLRAVWAGPAGAVWIVGDGGAVLRWDGAALRPVASTTTRTLRAVWGSGDEVWAAGDEGTVLRWRGAGFAAVPLEAGLDLSGRALTSISGTGPSDVWVAGEVATVLRYRGDALRRVRVDSLVGLRGIWAAADQKTVWAVGAGGQILQYYTNGDFLAPVSSGTGALLSGVWGSGAASAFAVSESGAVLRWNGLAWEALNSVTTEPLRGLWGSGADDLWLVGDLGTLLHRANNSFQRAPVAPGRRLRAVWGSSASDVWVAGDADAVMHLSGGKWSDVTQRAILNSIWGSGPSDVWLVGEGGAALRWDGAMLRPVAGASGSYYGVAGRGPSEVWLVGGESGVNTGKLQRWDGAALRSVGGALPTLYGAWVSSESGELWAVGRGGAVLRVSADAPQSVPTATSATLYAVWGSSARDLWVVGSGGTVLRWNGSAFTAVASGTTKDLRAVWGSADGGLWIAGGGGTLLRYQP